MASKVDMSLDDIVTLNKKKTGGKPFQAKPKFTNTGAGLQTQNGAQAKTADLRKVIANKQKANITDLRTKLKPKALYTAKFASKQGSKSNPSTPKSTHPRPKFNNEFTADTQRSRSRRSDPGPLSRARQSSPKLPSYEDAKKITVTVPGNLRTTSNVEVRLNGARLQYSSCLWLAVV